MFSMIYPVQSLDKVIHVNQCVYSLTYQALARVKFRGGRLFHWGHQLNHLVISALLLLTITSKRVVRFRSNVLKYCPAVDEKVYNYSYRYLHPQFKETYLASVPGCEVITEFAGRYWHFLLWNFEHKHRTNFLKLNDISTLLIFNWVHPGLSIDWSKLARFYRHLQSFANS